MDAHWFKAKKIFNGLLLVSAVAACQTSREFNESENFIQGASDDMSMTDESLLKIKGYVEKAGFPKWDQHRATCVVLCESGGRPTARNGVHVGLFQINETYVNTEGGRGVKHPTQKSWDASGRTCGRNLTEPQTNADCGFIRLSRAGWKDWDCGGAVAGLAQKVEACAARLDKRFGK
ncbi:MAG: hypothetical protein EBR09_07690 [Proteobacteria bacterium]|nr:hypothetical protein [Pseudomonadota bacterium]